jgi:hypothetical protein
MQNEVKRGPSSAITGVLGGWLLQVDGNEIFTDFIPGSTPFVAGPGNLTDIVLCEVRHGNIRV